MAEPLDPKRRIDVQINLPKPQGAITFPTVGELFAFIERQRQGWEWLNQLSVEQFTNEARESLRPYQRLRTIRADLEKELSDPKSTSAASILKSLYPACLLAESAEAQLAVSLSKIATPLVAGYFVATLKSKGNFNDKPQSAGAAIAAMFMLGSIPLSSNMELKAITNEAVEKLEAWKQNYVMDLDEKRAAFATYKQEVEQQIAKSKEELSQLADTYIQIKSLQEPATYWEAKRAKHNKYAWISGIVTILVAMGSGAGLVKASFAMRPDLIALTSPWQMVPYSFPVLLCFVGLFWLLRVLVRITMSHIHLASDAAERVVLATTFLTLLVRHKEMGEHLPIILSQLFRHAATGVVKDDAAPNWFLNKATDD